MAFNLDRYDRPADLTVATLDHLILSTPQPQALADFYHRALGYRFEAVDGQLIGRAEDRALVLTQGPAKSMASAGYRLPDAAELARLRARIAGQGVSHVNGPTVLFEDAVSVVDPDGNRYAFGIPPGGSSADQVPVPSGARLQHVVLASRQPDRIARFFVEVLGFTLSDDVVDDEGEVRTSFLRCSHEHHSFAVFLAAEDRLDHHCYETADWNAIRDWSDYMAARHIPLEWGPGRHGPGNNLFIFVHDPDGNWVELSAELEIVSHDRPVGRWPHEQRTLNSWGRAHLRS